MGTIPAQLIEQLPAKLEALLQQTLQSGEQVVVKLKGAYKQALVCTDSGVIILKTGQAGGAKVFQSRYQDITGVKVKFNVFSGHFELFSQRNKGTSSDPLKAPNCISLNERAQADKFRNAAAFISSKLPTKACATPAKLGESTRAATDGEGTMPSDNESKKKPSAKIVGAYLLDLLSGRPRTG
jgi:hypothetical protein